MQPISNRQVSRRSFLGLAAAVATLPVLSACSSGVTPDSPVKFWDMPWGAADYNTAAQKITEMYRPAPGLPGAIYQTIPWNSFYMTFASGIASRTGPAVSTGGGFQAFLFSKQEAIHYADNVVAQLRADEGYDDFLPGLIDMMRTPAGYVALPWQLDIRVLWYNTELLERAGADVPTDWDSLLSACRALKKIDVYGFGTGAGSGNYMGVHGLVLLMINNGGGLFDADGRLDCLNERNVEAMEFALQLVQERYIDPASVGYSSDNLVTGWKSGRVGLGIHTAGLAKQSGLGEKLQVTSPLTGPHGDRAGLVFVNNIMMYKDAPSPEASEAFLRYYLTQLPTLWEQGVVAAVPALKSIVATPKFQADRTQVKIVEEWQPVSKSLAAQDTTLSAGLASLDGGQALAAFTQTILSGASDARSALGTLQTAIEPFFKDV